MTLSLAPDVRTRKTLVGGVMRRVAGREVQAASIVTNRAVGVVVRECGCIETSKSLRKTQPTMMIQQRRRTLSGGEGVVSGGGVYVCISNGLGFISWTYIHMLMWCFSVHCSCQ